MHPQDNTAKLREALGYQIISRELSERRKAIMDAIDLDPGEKFSLETEWGESLGSVSRAKPTFEAVVDDPQVAWADLTPEESEVTLNPATIPDLIHFLEENGMLDFLKLEPSETAAHAHATAALHTWRRTGIAPAGWRIKEKTATPVRMTPTKLAKEMAEDFLAQNVTALAFTPAGEITKGQEQ